MCMSLSQVPRFVRIITDEIKARDPKSAEDFVDMLEEEIDKWDNIDSTELYSQVYEGVFSNFTFNQ